VSAELLLRAGAHPIIGHRGASGLAPENTIASFDLALEQGAEAFEFDLRMTRDGVPVVFHDPTLDRTTDGKGPLLDRALADLPRFDAGARFSADGGRTFPFRGQGVRIPTLAEMLARYPQVPFLIELKEVGAAGPAAEEIARAGAENRVVVASFHDQAVAPFRRRPFHPGASRREIVRLAAGALVGHAVDDPAELYAVPDRYRDLIPVPTRRFVAAATRLGKPVHVWTVNDPERANRLWDVGCSGMITNFPGLLLAARRSRFGS